jgi:rRNA pseudouridine-1189 N-methylase Emg1 (Nep1/Mra1 family)
MVQLLKKEKIKSADNSACLLKIVPGPITNYFPENAVKIGTSTRGKLVNIG